MYWTKSIFVNIYFSENCRTSIGRATGRCHPSGDRHEQHFATRPGQVAAEGFACNYTPPASDQRRPLYGGPGGKALALRSSPARPYAAAVGCHRKRSSPPAPLAAPVSCRRQRGDGRASGAGAGRATGTIARRGLNPRRASSIAHASGFAGSSPCSSGSSPVRSTPTRTSHGGCSKLLTGSAIWGPWRTTSASGSKGVVGWFDRNLKAPSRTDIKLPYDSKQYERVVFWFRPEARQHIQKMREVAVMLQHHGVPHRVLKTDKPGRVVYSDEFQVGAIPYRDGIR